jgi:pimeloyl-ACP methyl ester carboxylesterase
MLTELGHDQADVLGISWGGAVAQHFAAFQRAGAAGWCWSRPRRARR